MSEAEIVIQQGDSGELVIEQEDPTPDMVIPIESEVQAIEIVQTGPQGPEGITDEYFTFFYGGPLATTNGEGHDIVMEPGTITDIRARVDQPPVGGGIDLRVELNGGQIATFAIADGGTTGHFLGLEVPVVAGDSITVDITNVGADEPGDTLTVKIRKGGE
jgi:hypothetical protein